MSHLAIDQIILQTPDVFYFSFENQYEVTPNEFVPIFINMKNTLNDHTSRKLISEKLAGLVGKDFDHICGIESGGNYYVSSVADILNKPLSFLRRKKKAYGDKSLIVGQMPKPGSRVAILDDVFATGVTSYRAVKYFKLLKCHPTVISIFSFGFEKEIGIKMKTNVFALTNFSNVINLAIEKKLIDRKEAIKLSQYIQSYKGYI